MRELGTFWHSLSRSRSVRFSSATDSKNKFEKVGVFFCGQFGVVSNHTFTTNPPRFTTHFTMFCAPEIAKPPAKTPLR
jgi:hypothetical protein